MSQRDIRLWLIDIRDSIGNILTFSDGLDLERFDRDIVVKHAVLHNFAIIGEAVSKLPDSLKENYPEIPWREIKGFRNYVIHEYFGLDASIIWQIIQTDLPQLKGEISQILESQNNPDQ